MTKDRSQDAVDARASAPTPAQQGGVDAFLSQVHASPPRQRRDGRGRLIFAMDATMSRRPSWDQACSIQGDLFLETDGIGGLDVQLVYFRGYRDCRASRWAGDGATLLRLMSSVDCRGGRTQIHRVLKHVEREAAKAPVDAVVYVGDCCEEAADALCDRAGHLGAIGTPLLMFHEGGEPRAARIFRELARLSGGAYAPFDLTSPAQLRSLLRAAAVYAAGGRAVLEGRANGYGAGAVKLLQQMR